VKMLGGQPIEAHKCLQMLNMPVFRICIYKFDIYKPFNSSSPLFSEYPLSLPAPVTLF